jgi:hypothetical protein
VIEDRADPSRPLTLGKIRGACHVGMHDSLADEGLLPSAERYVDALEEILVANGLPGQHGQALVHTIVCEGIEPARTAATRAGPESCLPADDENPLDVAVERSLECYRPYHRHLHTHRVRQLLRRRWI